MNEVAPQSKGTTGDPLVTGLVSALEVGESIAKKGAIGSMLVVGVLLALIPPIGSTVTGLQDLPTAPYIATMAFGALLFVAAGAVGLANDMSVRRSTAEVLRIQQEREQAAFAFWREAQEKFNDATAKTVETALGRIAANSLGALEPTG